LYLLDLNIRLSFAGMNKKMAVVIFLFTGISNALSAQINEKIWNYILQYRDIAISEMNRAGIPASITLAQGLLESGIGESRLAVEGNNHFGIKCHDWKGPSVNHTDDAPNECFRKYNNAYESYLDHSDFLTGRKRYQVLFTYDREDYKRWAKGLKRCGYATNPKYADLLIQKIELYYLHIFDKPNWQDLWAIVETNRQLSMNETYTLAMESSSQSTKPVEPSKIETENVVLHNSTSNPIDEAASNQIASPNSPVRKNEQTIVEPVLINPSSNAMVNKGFNFTQINNLRAVTYTHPITVADVAAANKVKIKKLFRFNELDRFTTFNANTPIFLQNKKRKYKGSESVHQVKANETIGRIAQQYGVKTCVLQKLNLLHPTQEPRTDELIFLKKKRKLPPRIR